MTATITRLDDAARLWTHLFDDQPYLLSLFSGFLNDARRLDMPATRFYPRDKLEDALAWAAQQDAINREVYFCAHQVIGQERKKEQAAPVLAMYADVDGAALMQNPIAPTAVVESSPGHAHVYARLSRAVAPTQAERLNRRWALALGADPSGFDMSQVLRVPGTHNRKYGEPHLVLLRSLDEDLAYDPEELERRLPQLAEKSRERTLFESDSTVVLVGEEPPVRLRGDALRRWQGEAAAFAHTDRSWRLCEIARDLLRANASKAIVRAAIAERDQALEILGKFSDPNRRDAEARYDEIIAWAWEQLGRDESRNGHTPTDDEAADAIRDKRDKREKSESGADEAARVVRVGRVQVDTETGEVLEDPDEWPAPIDPAAFYGALGAFVTGVSAETEADPAAVLVMNMSAISALLDPHTHLKAGNAYHPTRINAILVGPTSSGRKGTAGKIAEAVAREADDGFVGHIVEGLSSGEGLLWAIRDQITKLDPKTGTEIVVDAGVVDKRLWVLETEWATTLRVLQRDGNSLSPIIRRAWDLAPDGVLRSLTKNSPARSTGAHVAIAGHITRHELLQTIERTDLVNGFANRFLWIASRRSRALPFGEEVQRQLVADFAEVVSAARDWTREGHRMRWAPTARERWAEAYASLGSNRDDLFSAVTARGAPQVLRMTELYATLDGEDQLQLQHLEAALAVWQYVERTCRWIWGDALGDPLADEIMAALRRVGPMTRTEIYDFFKRNERKARIEQALGRLLVAGLARCTKGQTGGRPAEMWTAV